MCIAQVRLQARRHSRILIPLMDLRTYFQLFWIPAIVSAALLALLWTRGARAPVFPAGWFVVALIAQYTATTSSLVWAAGLVLQTALAIVLLLKVQSDQI